MCVDGVTGVLVCVTTLANKGNPPTTCHTCFAVKEEPHYVTISCKECFEEMCDTSPYIGFGRGSMEYQHGCYKCMSVMFSTMEYTTSDATVDQLIEMDETAGIGIRSCAHARRLNQIFKLYVQLTEPVTQRIDRNGDMTVCVFAVTPKRFPKSARGAI